MKVVRIGIFKALMIFVLAVPILLGLLALYLCWRLFAALVSRIGIGGIRNVNGCLQTSTVFYEHPVTRRKVVLIGTIHIAEAEYFAALQKVIDSLAGHRILFERVGKLTQQEETSLTDEEREVAKGFERVFGLTVTLCTLMSLQHQSEGLVYSPTWVNTDVRMYELIKQFARHNLLLMKAEEDLRELLTDEGMQRLARWLFNKIFSRFVPYAMAIRIGTHFSRKGGLLEEFILESRNEVAMRGIESYLPEGDVASIWGAAHLRGIGKSLKRAGFREVRREWFTAYHDRPYSLLECLKWGEISVSTAKTVTALKKD